MWGPVVLVGTLALYGFLLGRIRVRSQAADEKPWWFGYSRDGSNLLALAGTTAGWAGVGFPPPLALLAGFAITLLVYLVDYWVGRGLRREIAGWLAAACGVGVAGLGMMAPQRIVAALTDVLHHLF